MTNEAAAFEAWRDRRDAEAFRALVLRYSGMVYATCQRVLRNAPEAEDVTQECFQALASLDRSPRNGAIGPWLHGVALNRCLQEIRSRGRRRAREMAYASEQPTRAEIVWDDIYAYVDEAIAALPARMRAPLVAHYLESQSMRDVARQLGLAPSTVSARIDKGIKQIRRQLQKRGIAITTAALVGLFTTNISHAAAPQALMATLAKIALAGAGKAATVAVATAAGIGIGLKAVLTAILLIAAVAGVFFVSTVESEHAVMPEADATTAENQPLETTAVTPESSQEATVSRESAATRVAPIVSEKIGRGPASIYGRVIDERKQAVPNAPVNLYRTSEDITTVDFDMPVASTKTGERGLFSFERIPEGNYVTRAVVGSVTAYGSHQLQLPKGTKVSDAARGYYKNSAVDLMLASTSTLRGHVKDSTGSPIPGATVWVRQSVIRDNTSFLPFASGMTRADGSFEIQQLGKNGLASGDYGCYVTAPDSASLILESITYSDDPLKFVLQHGGAISGRLAHSSDDISLAGMEVVALSDGTFPQSPHDATVDNFERLGLHVTTDENGAFTFPHLIPGKKRLALLHDSMIISNSFQTYKVQNGTRITDLVLGVETGASISGKVRDPETKEAVAGAVIFAQSKNPAAVGRSAVSDSNGSYRIEGLPGGDYEMRTIDDLTWEVAARRVVVAPGEDVTGVDWEAFGLRPVTGKVVDEAGTGMGGVAIFVSPEKLHGARTSRVVSGPGGVFELAASPAWGSFVLTGDWFYTSGRLKEPLEVSRDGLNGIVLRLDAKRLSSISGTALKSEGSPVFPGRVVAHELTRDEYAWSDVSEKGEFLVADLQKGVYSLLAYPARPDGGADGHSSPSIDIALGDEEQRSGVALRVPLTKQQTISGRVTDKRGNPIAGAKVQAWDFKSFEATTDDDGHFELEVSPGNYEVNVFHQDFTGQAVRSVESNTTDLDVVLEDAATVRGRVIDAVSRVSVTDFELRLMLFEPNHSNDLSFQNYRQSEGAFELTVPGGHAQLEARAPGYAETQMELHVAPGENTELEIALTRGIVLEGIVLSSPDRKPISDACVVANYTWNDDQARSVTTGMDGRFRLDEVASYDSIVWASHPGYAVGKAEFVANDDGTAYAEILMGKGGTVRGTVYVAGKKAVKAYVSLRDTNRSYFKEEPNDVKNGEYEFDSVSPGAYDVEVSFNRGCDTGMNEHVQRTVMVEEGKVTIADFAIPAGWGGIEGVVTIGGEPPFRSQINAEIRTTVGDHMGFGNVDPTTGAYNIECLSAGEGTLSITATLDGENWLTQAHEIEILDGQVLQKDIEFGATARISGTVTGIRDPDSSVCILRGEFHVEDYPEESLLGEIVQRIVQNNQGMGEDGPFAFDDLQPGIYTLMAWTSPAPGATGTWSHTEAFITLEAGDDLKYDLILD